MERLAFVTSLSNTHCLGQPLHPVGLKTLSRQFGTVRLTFVHYLTGLVIYFNNTYEIRVFEGAVDTEKAKEFADNLLRCIEKKEFQFEHTENGIKIDFLDQAIFLFQMSDKDSINFRSEVLRPLILKERELESQ